MTKNTPTVKIIVATHKKYEMPQDAMYLPLHVGAEGKTDQNGNPLDLGYQKDNTGENISNKNAAYCELTGLYWAWKNLDTDYTGLAHYRRHFGKKTKAPFEGVLTYNELRPMLEKYKIPLQAELLTGSMTMSQKKKAYARIESGEAAIIIGTHALIQEKVLYRNLALVVTDEQHRFGVRQRETLAQKGKTPHILVMSATPIPRTLAIILYGDLDISIINEMPKNRLPIKNCVVNTEYREKAYRFMRKQVLEGRQCYVICPMVEESESLDAENVIDYSQMLAEELGDGIHVGCLHGKMKQKEKDEIMSAFGKNEIQILVSTTVVEVGIDVPNATVMLIENAERFGLAQLHQLRGRVGRGGYQSYCIFMSASKSDETKERLEILNRSNDGFFIAGEDLRLRGPGDLFGIRQSGILDFKIADVFQDAEVLKIAGEEANKILKRDPELKDPSYKKIKNHIDHKIQQIMLETTL